MKKLNTYIQEKLVIDSNIKSSLYALFFPEKLENEISKIEGTTHLLTRGDRSYYIMKMPQIKLCIDKYKNSKLFDNIYVYKIPDDYNGNIEKIIDDFSKGSTWVGYWEAIDKEKI